MPSHNIEHVSISQMIQNPTGKHSAFFASRARVKAQLDTIFIKNLRRFRKEFYAVPYIDDITHDIIFYVSVPSEAFHMNRIRYDCLVKIKFDNKKLLENRDAQFFTNSPSFIYTYAYVFNQEDLIPDFIKPNMPIQCLTQPPVIKNPVESRGFDKILYQALKYLVLGGCLTNGYLDKFKQRWNNITRTEVIKRCANTENLVSIYQHAKRLEALKRNTNRKKITTAQKNKMEREASRYERFKKANTPTYVGMIIKKAPRSKITARKASKYINTVKKRKPSRTTMKY